MTSRSIRASTRNPRGATLRLGFPLNLNTYLRTRYTLHADNVVVDDSSCTSGTISITICEQRGSTVTSALGYTLDYDKRNDPIHPTRGYSLEINQDFAGVGGTVKYVKTEVSGTFYHGFTPAWVMSLKGEGGYLAPLGGDVSRINDRFFKGGQSFPGFETAGIGPRDTTYDEALGGKLYTIGSVELTLPNGLPEQYGIRTSLFTYAGTLGSLDNSIKLDPTTGVRLANVVDDLAIRASAGLSVFWTSPLGPIRLDFSQILAKRSYDKTEAFRFSHQHTVLSPMTSKILLGAAAVAALSTTFVGVAAQAQSRSRAAPAAAPSAAAPAASAPARPAQPPLVSPTSPRPIAGVCVFSEERAVGTSKAGQAANARMQQLRAQVQAEIAPEATSLQNDVRTFQAQRATLAGDALTQRQTALQGRADAFQQKEQLRNQELQATGEKALGRIRAAIEPIVRQTYEARKCSILFNSDGAIFGGNPQMDVTPTVVAGLDAAMPTLTFDREHIDPAAAAQAQR